MEVNLVDIPFSSVLKSPDSFDYYPTQLPKSVKVRLAGYSRSSFGLSAHLG